MHSDCLTEQQKQTPVSLAEYLHTSYQPDCEYLDGHVQERCVGEWAHSRLLGLLLGLIYQERAIWNVDCFPTYRVQVSPTRILVPDLTVLRVDTPREPVLRTAPLLVIEILSPQDTFIRLQQRVNDFIASGVEHIWVIDPYTRCAYRADAHGFHEPVTPTLSIPGTPIEFSLTTLWQEVDRTLQH